MPPQLSVWRQFPEYLENKPKQRLEISWVEETETSIPRGWGSWNLKGRVVFFKKNKQKTTKKAQLHKSESLLNVWLCIHRLKIHTAHQRITRELQAKWFPEITEDGQTFELWPVRMGSPQWKPLSSHYLVVGQNCPWSEGYSSLFLVQLKHSFQRNQNDPEIT